MAYIKKFLLLSSQDKLMLLINYLLCGFARALTLSLPYKQLSAFFGHRYWVLSASTLISKDQLMQAVRIRRSISLAARYTPWNSNCLTQATIAAFWCKYYKIPYLLFIGFAKKSEKPLGQDAHAWVTSGPIPITGGLSFHSHQVIYTYSNCLFN